MNLTKYPSNWKWGCEVTDFKTHDEVVCTREIPAEADFDTGQIRYGSQIVVNAVGYSWQGSELSRGFFEFGGQVTLQGAYQALGTSTVAAATTLILASNYLI